jgi:hypothetical protein
LQLGSAAKKLAPPGNPPKKIKINRNEKDAEAFYLSTMAPELSIIDQTICRHYIRNLLCFGLPEHVHEDAIISVFEHAVKDGIFRRWPFLHQRIRLVPGRGPLGPVQLVDSYHGVMNGNDQFLSKQEFSVKKLVDWANETAPVYSALQAAGVPPSCLKTSMFCPLPDSPDLSVEDGSPVFHLSLTFIHGGLIVAVYLAHSIVDGAGLGIILEELAANVRNPSEAAQQRKPGMPLFCSQLCYISPPQKIVFYLLTSPMTDKYLDTRSRLV